MKTKLTLGTPIPLQRLHLGLIGCNFIGNAHFDAAGLSRAFQVTHTAPSRSLEKGIPIAGKLGIPAENVFAGGEAMIVAGVKSLNGVIIATPNKSHSPLAITALKGGLHVICDKPMSHDLASAEAMYAEAAAHPHLLAGCTFQNLGNPMLHVARHLWETGGISDGNDDRVICQGTYFQGWLKKPRQPGDGGFDQESWRVDPDQSGEAGGLGDIGGSHAFGAIDFVTGGNVFRNGTVVAHLNIDVTDRKVDDNGVMIATGKNGARAVIQHSQTMTGKKNDISFTVSGNQGTVVFDSNVNSEMLVYTKANGDQMVFHKGVNLPGNIGALCTMPPGHPEGYHNWMANIYRLFAARIHELETGSWPTDFIPNLPFPTFEDGIAAQRFINACLLSSKGGSSVNY